MIEVIATSKKDVLRLNNSKIDRIELCSEMEYDGLSPTINTVNSCLEVSKKPIRVMLRITPDFCIHNYLNYYLEYINCLKDFNSKYLDGIVLGFLKDDNLDYVNCSKIIKHAYPLKVTFHKAAEILIERDNLELLIKLFDENENLDTILTQGGISNINNNLNKLKHLNNRFPILIGGGVTRDNFKTLSCISSNIHLGSAIRLEKDYTNDFDYDFINDITN